MYDEKGYDFQAYLYAYSLGCLDKEDYIHLVEHLESGESFPWQELGEFQNLSSLLPSFLNTEEPAANVKDRVARRLYRLRDEKKPDFMEKKPSSEKVSPLSRTQTVYHDRLKTTINEAPVSVPPTPAQVNIPDEDIPVPKEFKPATGSTGRRPLESSRPQQDTQIKNRGQRDNQERERMPDDRADFQLGKIPSDSEQESDPLDEFIINQTDSIASEPKEKSFRISDEPKIVDLPSTAGDLEAIRKQVVANVEHQSQQVNEDQPAKTGISTIIFLLIVLLLAAGMTGLYLFFSPKLAKSENELKQLRQEMQTALHTNSQTAEYSTFITLKESVVLSLKGTAKYSDAYGQYVYNSGNKQGFIMLAGLPATPAESGYQLWMESNGIKTPIGIPTEFGNAGMKIEFNKLSFIPSVTKNMRAAFYITLEKRGQQPAAPSKEKFLSTED
ncbi:MAG: anti-sigma factor [Ignavibacteria bacterium]|nr:anti-sigma factor [Ignavibacteria bacterium]